MGLIILSMLAVWRAIHILQEEVGPAAIFSRLQAYLAKRDYKPGSFSDGFFCFNCMSVWLSIIPSLLLCNSIFKFILYTLSISAGAIIIDILLKTTEQ